MFKINNGNNVLSYLGIPKFKLKDFVNIYFIFTRDIDGIKNKRSLSL